MIKTEFQNNLLPSGVRETLTILTLSCVILTGGVRATEVALRHSLTMEGAKKIAEAAVAFAKNNGASPSIAIVTPLQGGVPVMHEGHVVGAIGVSGAKSAAQDEEVAKAGAEILAGRKLADAP